MKNSKYFCIQYFQDEEKLEELLADCNIVGVNGITLNAGKIEYLINSLKERNLLFEELKRLVEATSKAIDDGEFGLVFDRLKSSRKTITKIEGKKDDRQDSI